MSRAVESGSRRITDTCMWVGVPTSPLIDPLGASLPLGAHLPGE